MARPRLLEQLKQSRRSRCVVLQGPAGCGKTSLLAAWRRELMAGASDVVWLGLGAGDNAIAPFMERLLAALSQVDAGMAGQVAALAGPRTQDGALESLAVALVRSIAARANDVVLCLDDAHHLHDARILAALQFLLDHGPAQLFLVFTARSPLSLSLARLRAQGELLELGWEALRLTPAESQEWAHSLLPDCEQGLVRSLQGLAEGWAAGLKLACLQLRQAGDSPAGVQRLHDDKTFGRYFKQTLLTQLSPEDLQLLLRCALLEHFHAALCAALADDGAGPQAVEEQLAGLQDQGVVMLPAGRRHGAGWWRLHPLLRDALQELVDAMPAQQRQDLHARAWQWCAERSMVHDAVHHALQAGAADAAAELVDASASGFFVQGELRRLVGLVRQLPPAQVQARHSLRLWMAWAQVYERRLAECADSLAKLQRDLASGTAADRLRLTLLRGLYAVQCDDSAAAMVILPQLLEVPADADAIALTGRRNLLTWIYLYRGDYEKARLVQLGEVPPSVHGQPLHGTPFGLLTGRCLVGLTHAVEGQVIQAERIYRDVLHEADRRGSSCIDASCLAAGLLAEVLYELNDPAGAVQLLQQRLEVLERVSIPDTVMRAMLVMVRSHRLAGRPLDALAYLEQTDEYAERLGLDRLLAYSLMEQVSLQLGRNAPEAAREPMAKLDAVDARHSGAEVGTLSEIHVAAERARIQLALHAGDWSSALQRLSALEALCRARGRVRRIPYLRLLAAVCEQRLGHGAAAQAQVREALRLGNRLGLVRTLLDAHPAAPQLIQEAVDSLDDDPVLRFYAERLCFAARTLPAAARPEASHQGRAGWEKAFASLSPREAEIVGLLLQAMPNKKIARVLSLSLDTVKWHLKNCYGKLDVSGRDEVVERMRDLGRG